MSFSCNRKLFHNTLEVLFAHLSRIQKHVGEYQLQDYVGLLSCKTRL